ncbi:MAG: tetratricopeptide repeat protein [Endomicrobiales bacterium]
MKNRHAAAKIIALSLGLLVPFLLVECFLFARGERRPAVDDDFRYHYLDMYRSAFRRVDTDGPPRYESCRKRLKPLTFPVRKPASTKRLFIIGASTAQQLDEETVARAFRRALPEYDFEVINCGMGGFDASRTALMGKEVLKYSPDCVIVIEGNNEFTGLRKVNRWKYEGPLSHSAVFRRLCDLFAPPVFLKKTTQTDRYFVSSLSLFLEEASRRSVPVILCTLPVNYRDNHFDAIGYWGTPLPGEDLCYDRDYIFLLEALRRRDADGAQRSLSALQERHPGSVFLEFYQSLVSELEGDYGGARAAIVRALDADPDPIVCSPRQNRMIRGLAAQYRLPLADIEREVLALAPRGIPGFDLFFDQCHYWPPVSRVYAESMAGALISFNRGRKEPLLAPAGHRAAGALTRTTYAELVAAVPAFRSSSGDRQLIQRMLFNALGNRPFSAQAVQYFQMLYEENPSLLASLRVGGGEFRATLENDWFRSLVPAVDAKRGRLLVYAGEALRRLGRWREALPFFDGALALDPDDAQAYYFRAWTWRALQGEKEAEADLAAAFRLKPGLRQKYYGEGAREAAGGPAGL